MNTDLTPELRQMIAEGQTRGLCPACGGGSSKERSLQRWYDISTHRHVFRCWRASCGASWADLDMTPQSGVRPVRPEFKTPTRPLTPAVYDLLAGRWGIEQLTVENRWTLTASGDRLVMPVLDAYGVRTGLTTRTLGRKKTVRTYKFDPTGPQLLDFWCQPHSDGEVFVVEDQLSAARVAQLGANAVALLGTRLSDSGALQLAGRPIVLALDADAFDKALAMQTRYEHMLDIRGVRWIEPDLKDQEFDEDVRRVLWTT